MTIGPYWVFTKKKKNMVKKQNGKIILATSKLLYCEQGGYRALFSGGINVDIC